LNSQGEIKTTLKLESEGLFNLSDLWRGFSSDFVQMSGNEEFQFAVAGTKHYLAIHDIMLEDGEIYVGGSHKAIGGKRDLRNQLTYSPAHYAIEGWSKTSQRHNSFTALYFDPDVLAEDVETKHQLSDRDPQIYFENATLRDTMLKLQYALQNRDLLSKIYIESLGLVAAVEVCRSQGQFAQVYQTSVGTLSSQHQRLILEFIDSHLTRDISVEEMAKIVSLSRFHFIRAFKTTFGQTPHRYVIIKRVERSMDLLRSTRSSVKDVAAASGFTTVAQYIRMFRDFTGTTPGQFKRNL
jgi:AraC family transcriptional regulator